MKSTAFFFIKLEMEDGNNRTWRQDPTTWGGRFYQSRNGYFAQLPNGYSFAGSSIDIETSQVQPRRGATLYHQPVELTLEHGVTYGNPCAEVADDLTQPTNTQEYIEQRRTRRPSEFIQSRQPEPVTRRRR